MSGGNLTNKEQEQQKLQALKLNIFNLVGAVLDATGMDFELRVPGRGLKREQILKGSLPQQEIEPTILTQIEDVLGAAWGYFDLQVGNMRLTVTRRTDIPPQQETVLSLKKHLFDLAVAALAATGEDYELGVEGLYADAKRFEGSALQQKTALSLKGPLASLIKAELIDAWGEVKLMTVGGQSIEVTREEIKPLVYRGPVRDPQGQVKTVDAIPDNKDKPHSPRKH